MILSVLTHSIKVIAVLYRIYIYCGLGYCIIQDIHLLWTWVLLKYMVWIHLVLFMFVTVFNCSVCVCVCFLHADILFTNCSVTNP